MLKSMLHNSPHYSPMFPERGENREEIIANFNNAIDNFEKKTASYIIKNSTCDFTRKAKGRAHVSLSSLRSISLAELEVGNTYRGCVVYCQIATRVMPSTSAMLLVEDDSALVDLAVYGSFDRKKLKEGLMIAIKEPYYKSRIDGSEGIRVDEPTDIIFDVKKMATSSVKEVVAAKRGTVEERLEELVVEELELEDLVLEENNKGVTKLYTQLVDEGYIISKKRVRALKRAVLAKFPANKDNVKSPIIPIISERCPEKHRVYRIAKVLEYKEAGNKSLMSKSYAQADKLYSESLKYKNDPSEESVEEVSLWQLYSNRAAARMKLGKLHEALQDSLESNICAPSTAAKPLLRCAEALVCLGLHKEADHLLTATVIKFPDTSDTVDKKRHSIFPKSTLRVGKEHEFETISMAIHKAPAGAEILVDSGIYHESLFIDKPLTLRCNTINDYDAIKDLEGIKTSKWAKIFGTIACNLSSTSYTVHIIGFKISCTKLLKFSSPAVIIMHGVAVLRNCMITSSSGPVVCAENAGTNVIIQDCAVHDGAQGGILAADGARLSMHQVHCCRNAASGLELRSKGFASLDGCHFYSNGKQGIVAWKNAGQLIAKQCEIHSHKCESGVIIMESSAQLDGCTIYGNNVAGIVSQNKGKMYIFNCEVHNNCEGILIQDTSKAYVEKCKVHSNRGNGIFVGFDHRGSAAIIENEVYDNQSKGILVGNSGKVKAHGNVEYGNLGLRPQIPMGLNPKAYTVSKKQLKRMNKNIITIQKATEESKPVSLFDSILKTGYKEHGMDEKVMEDLKEALDKCSNCKVLPSDDKPSLQCGRCKIIFYCSLKCQKIHWSEHKKTCTDTSIKYPSFLDNNVSI